MPGLRLFRSQTFSAPSSPPEANIWLVSRFHDITFTSVLCALIDNIDLWLVLVSQILMVLSEEHDAKTVPSVGLHWISSTEEAWPCDRCLLLSWNLRSCSFDLRKNSIEVSSHFGTFQKYQDLKECRRQTQICMIQKQRLLESIHFHSCKSRVLNANPCWGIMVEEGIGSAKLTSGKKRRWGSIGKVDDFIYVKPDSTAGCYYNLSNNQSVAAGIKLIADKSSNALYVSCNFICSCRIIHCEAFQL